MSNKKIKSNSEDGKFPLPVYDKNDDIYSRAKEESLDENNSGEEINTATEEGTGDELDIPGAEQDDLNESIGEEDEENNYYSLGGDNHNELEEDGE